MNTRGSRGREGHGPEAKPRKGEATGPAVSPLCSTVTPVPPPPGTAEGQGHALCSKQGFDQCTPCVGQGSQASTVLLDRTLNLLCPQVPPSPLQGNRNSARKAEEEPRTVSPRAKAKVACE